MTKKTTDKKEKDYEVETEKWGDTTYYTVKTKKNGKNVSIQDTKQVKKVVSEQTNKITIKVESKAQVIKRLCAQLGVEY